VGRLDVGDCYGLSDTRVREKRLETRPGLAPAPEQALAIEWMEAAHE